MTNDDVIQQLTAAAALRGASVKVMARVLVTEARGAVDEYSLDAGALTLMTPPGMVPSTVDAAIALMGAVVAPPPPPPPPSPPVAPAAPSGLTAVAGNASVSLAWSVVPGATAYRLKIGTVAGVYFGSFDLPGNSGTFSNPPLTNGTKYFFAVSALGPTGLQSVDSAPVSATPVGAVVPPPPPPPPAPLPPPPAPPPPSGQMLVGSQWWNPGWTTTTASVLAAGATFADGVDPFSPTLEAEFSKYTGSFRVMDAMATNSTSVAAWTDRTKVNDPLLVQTNELRGFALEHLITFANKTKRRLWINIPHMTQVGSAANDYALQAARLIRDRLDPSLGVAVEYSNECWNFGYGGAGKISPARWCSQQGAALKLTGDQYEQAYRFYGIAAAKCWDAFETVFGKGSPRLTKVLSGPRDDRFQFDVGLEEARKVGQNPTVYAVAPYFHASTVDGLQADMTAMFGELKGVISAVKAQGFPWVCYEAGQECSATRPDAPGPADVINRDPKMYGIIKTYLDTLASLGCQEVCLYLHASQYDKDDAWGYEEFPGQDLAKAHKLRAVYDWIASHR